VGSGRADRRGKLPDAAHRFLAGHRIRLQVSGGAHPRFARNLGTGEPFATVTTGRVCRFEVFHDAAHPSQLELPILG
jgi:predicted acyl esterase